MKFSWRLAQAGLANLAISYNVVCVSLSLKVMDEIYTETVLDASLSAGSLMVGMVLGQLFFGGMGDFLGRERALLCALGVCLTGAVGSVIFTSSSTQVGLGLDIFEQLTIWRCVLGIGAGGIYPLAAVLAKEAAAEAEIRTSTAVTLVFSMQGIGYLLAPVTMLALISVPSAYDTQGVPKPWVWRCHLGMGAVLVFIVSILVGLVLRKKNNMATQMSEFVELPQIEASTPTHSSTIKAHASSFTVDTPGTQTPAHTRTRARTLTNNGLNASMHNNPSISRHLSAGAEELLSKVWTQRNLTVLLGTAIPWFLFDITFYGNTLFEPVVLKEVLGGGYTTNGDVSEDLDSIETSCYEDLLLKSVAVPGYIFAVAFVDRIGPKRLQCLGFCVLTIAYASMGILLRGSKILPITAITVYGLSFFFSNFGPNSTTFMLPSLLFKEDVRSTMSGISAASGKMGAILGTLAFTPMSMYWGVPSVLMVCSGAALAGLILTYKLIPKDMIEEIDGNIRIPGMSMYEDDDALQMLPTTSISSTPSSFRRVGNIFASGAKAGTTVSSNPNPNPNHPAKSYDALSPTSVRRAMSCDDETYIHKHMLPKHIHMSPPTTVTSGNGNGKHAHERVGSLQRLIVPRR